LVELTEDGVTLALVTHGRDLPGRFATRTGQLVDGRAVEKK
jgi:predicted ABC-type transport system involved in lysophospholipase L1 biosynthesis ATPase subunit